LQSTIWRVFCSRLNFSSLQASAVAIPSEEDKVIRATFCEDISSLMEEDEDTKYVPSLQ
jgi:hypothetical protein